jgi:hypothetical protein
MTKSATSPLDRVIKKYENQLPASSKNARADLQYTIERYLSERAKNPGLFFLSDIQLHFDCLHMFLHTAAKTFADQKRLSAIQGLVEALYEYDLNDEVIRLYNPILQISGDLEPVAFPSMPIHETESFESNLMKEVWKDINRNAPKVTKKMILGWCGIIKELEIKRMQILASAALLALRNPNKADEHRATNMALLERSWTRFHKSFYNIYRSPTLSNLAAAINEMGHSISRNRSKPIRLTDLPKRLFLRKDDYINGRNNLELIDKQEDKSLSLDLLIEKYDGEMPPLLADKKSTNVLNDVKLKIIIENLSPAKHAVFKKCVRGEKLSTNERKIKSRMREEFEKEILGY